jgi:Carboxypeptidase regulatory-like domain/TonB dependent receptor
VLGSKLSILLLLCGLCSAGTAAQSSSVISGTVQDPSGAVIPYASIELQSSPGNSSPVRAKSDSNGNFRLQDVAPGSYHLVISASGFKDATIALTIAAKRTAPLRITLELASQSESVTVGGADVSPQISSEASENQSANTFERNALDRVPIFDQDYITTLSRFLDDNATSTNGVSLVVNGIEANGPGVTPSAIQEVRINQNPYTVFFANPGRARLEITTKPGTADFHGTVNFLYRNAVFDAANAFATQKPDESRQYYEGSLSGPLSRDKKTTFLLSLERDMDSVQTIVDAITLAGPIHENVPAPIHHSFAEGRVFHTLASGDLFWIGYSYENSSYKNQNVGGNVLPEAGYDSSVVENEINVSYRHTFSTSWINQLRFLVGENNQPRTSVNEAPQIIVSGAFTGGGAQADSRRTEYHFDGTDIVTWIHGKHLLNFGIDVPDISRRGADDFTNQLGSYTFASLAAFQANTPSTVTIQQGNGHLVFLEKVIAGFVEDSIRVNPKFSVTVGVRYYWQNYFHDDPNNFAPRFSLAYAPSSKSKTVFRGGAGVFYDRTGPRPIADLLHFNGVNLLRFIVTDPTFPVSPAEIAATPSSVVTLDARLHIPYRLQYGFAIERQVTAKSTFSAGYVGSRGISLFRSIDANAPLLPPFTTRPDPALGQNRQIQSDGYQKSNALELTFRGQPSKYFSGQIQYTLSKTYNNTQGITYFPATSYDPAADWARSDNDRRHKFDLLGSSHFTKLFTVGAALSLYSGKPVNVTTGADNNGDGVVNDRPAGRARNTLHGPGLINLDLNLAHDFAFKHRDKQKDVPTLTVSINSFNILNHPNYVTFVGLVTSPFFGQPVAANPPRRTQLNLEFKF